jgi:hypothetical protein
LHRSLSGGDIPPFSPETNRAIGEYADGDFDISDPTVWINAPYAALAVLAQVNGWANVRGPGPMTWREAAASLQLAAEEHHGAPTRARITAAYDAEQEAVADGRQTLEELTHE